MFDELKKRKTKTNRHFYSPVGYIKMEKEEMGKDL